MGKDPAEDETRPIDEPGVGCGWVKMVDSMAPESDLVMLFKGQCIESWRVLGFGFRGGEKEEKGGHWTSPACTCTGIPPSVLSPASDYYSSFSSSPSSFLHFHDTRTTPCSVLGNAYEANSACSNTYSTRSSLPPSGAINHTSPIPWEWGESDLVGLVTQKGQHSSANWIARFLEQGDGPHGLAVDLDPQSVKETSSGVRRRLTFHPHGDNCRRARCICAASGMHSAFPTGPNE